NDFIIDLFENDWKINNSILLIEPYVGLNYDFFNFGENVEAILHGTYHSGTVCSEDNEKSNGYDYDDYCNSILYLIDKVGNKKIYIAPSDLSGNIYETIKKIKEHQNGNVYFVNGVTKEMLYAKLLVAFSYEPLKRKITHFLSSEYNHEIVVEINGSQKLIDRVD
ncbi:MAG: hypothetical protein KBT46_03700, partial [Ruminococcus sp.]|nr:hypothetical protein [Candidatus Copronaster equi]